MDAEFLILATAGLVVAASTMGVVAIGVMFGRPQSQPAEPQEK